MYLSYKGQKPPLDSRLGTIRLRACSELDLLTLFQPVRHDTGFLLNKSGHRALSAQTTKRPTGVVPFKEIPLVPSLPTVEPKR